MSSNVSLQTTNFHNVAVTVTFDASGQPQVVCIPEVVTVDACNSVIAYQLVSAPEGVTFWGAQITPATQRQFSYPQINANGRMMTFDDLNNCAAVETFDITLQFTDADGDPFDFDPQVINRPG